MPFANEKKTFLPTPVSNGRRVKKRSAPPCFSFRVRVCSTRRQSLIRSRSCSVMRTCTMPIVHGLGTDPRSPFLESVARAAARYSTTAHTTSLKPDACGTRAPRALEGEKKNFESGNSFISGTKQWLVLQRTEGEQHRLNATESCRDIHVSTVDC